jgi:hypothetical protein
MGGGFLHRWLYGQLAQILVHIQELLYELTGKFG